MTDVELTIDLRDRRPDDRVDLEGTALDAVLEDGSQEALYEAVSSGSADHITLFAEDGRTFEARVTRSGHRASVALHDVTRHVDHADRFARMTLQMHRQYRDLQVLYDASVAFGDTLDVDALASIAARTVGGYLRADKVLVTVAGRDTVWGWPDARGGPTTVDLRTARGQIGTLCWWRAAGLREDERDVVDVLARRAAISLDHGLLLLPPPEADGRDPDGLVPSSRARRRLAGLRHAGALALVGPMDAGPDPAAAMGRIARVLTDARRGDLIARWGDDRILVALEDGDLDILLAWLDRRADRLPGAGRPPLAAGLATVAGDLDHAIALAAQGLEQARATTQAVVVVVDDHPREGIRDA